MHAPNSKPQRCGRRSRFITGHAPHSGVHRPRVGVATVGVASEGKVLAIRSAIYSAVDGQTGPRTPDECTVVTCGNITGPHQTNVCRATTDQKVGGSNPSER